MHRVYAARNCADAHSRASYDGLGLGSGARGTMGPVNEPSGGKDRHALLPLLPHLPGTAVQRLAHDHRPSLPAMRRPADALPPRARARTDAPEARALLRLAGGLLQRRLAPPVVSGARRRAVVARRRR